MVLCNESSLKLRNKLHKMIDTSDYLFIGKIAGDAAWTKTMADNSWLKSILTTQLNQKQKDSKS